MEEPMKTHPVAEARTKAQSKSRRPRTVEGIRACLIFSVAAGLLALGPGCSAESSSRQVSTNLAVPVMVVEQPAEIETSPAIMDARPVGTVAVVPQASELPPPIEPRGLTTSAGEVVHLAQARVGQDVMLAYIGGVETPFDLDPDAIVYLTDLGVPAETIASMVRRDQVLRGRMELAESITPEATEEIVQVEPQDYQAQVGDATLVEEPLPTLAVSEGYPSAASETVVVTEPTTQVTQNYFYNALSPYGSWVELPDYGWCWQPSVAVAQPDWRPYFNGGRWIWSDSGWYWQSYYSWGWAPFHYGRWHLSSNCGWVWAPGTRWGPAWVTWRYYDGYCGWAPLPPAAVYSTGIGFSYYGGRVGFSFGFGLSSGCYSFVPTSCFYTSRPWTYCVPSGTVNQFYGDTTVINNYVNGNNNTIINRGIGTETIAAATRSEIRKVRVTDTAGVGSRGAIQAERLTRDGTTLAAYRPQLPRQASQPPAAVTQRQEQAAVRSAALVESKAVAAARVRASSTENRTRLSAGNPTAASVSGRSSRSTLQPTGSPARATTRSSAQFSTTDRTLPVRTQRDESRITRTEPRRSAPSSTLERSLAAQSAANARTIPSSQRVESRAARSPARPAVTPSTTQPRSSAVTSPTASRTYSRTTTPSRAEPRRKGPTVSIPTSRSTTVTPRTSSRPTTREIINSSRSTSARNLPTRPTVRIPQGTIRSTPTTRTPTYRPPTVRRSAPSTVNSRSTPPSRTYTPRSAPAPRSTYTPPPSGRSAPSRAPSSSFRASPPASRSAPAPRSAPSSPSRTGTRSVPRR